MSINSAIVIGGGISGPVTATALHLAGIDVTVFEAYPGPAYGIGSNLALAPNGVAALEIVGAADAVRAHAVPIAKSSMSVNGKSFDLPGLTNIAPLRAIDRPVLHRVLHDNAVAAGVQFEYDKRLIDVEEHAGGVTARFSDGSTATADVLIGADGIRSTVRTLVDPKAPGPTYLRMLGLGAYVDCDLDLEPERMTFAFGKRAYYLYWPMPDGRVAWGANLPSEQYFSLTEARAVPVERWLDRLRTAYAGEEPGELLARSTTPEQLAVVGALHVMPSVPHWHRGRMVLTGDAIHAPSNTSGQGASLAIESGIELARCLRDIDDPARAFATYEALRRPRVEAVAARVARMNHTKAAGPVTRKAMQLMMPMMFKRMDPEKLMGHEQRFRIDWDTTVRPVAVNA
ncbi:FAD-dependent monooxygenase [Nocardia seriolae]|uniref:FAD-dependent urate hydroxylase n=1 Tax=Nocardia seriolae TaxID=37332 RepID=A0A0B8N1Z7_9NOCA|nr:NAD(P)/FAD-dependent oxidoreductase [Nocardia seriolae]APB01168.1 FAD-dependent urate hydroxylase [Nocardia seriolae]MTJ61328.1 NAD(P)-binding protein [Nocardia seriolae]MTJ71740.1 NAD(P)-binding protein [Nocardia seriolae]MTJ90548.1 NAD(P)-binding protein [Nocardia seriolae]MTK34508.1 NAD(P)-binding protein [Nocardia seriolae]